MARRLPLALCCALALTIAPAAHAASDPVGSLANWDRTEQRAVVRAGLMAPLSGGFHGEQPLSAGQLETTVSALSARLYPPAAPDPTTVDPSDPTAGVSQDTPVAPTVALPAGGSLSVMSFDRVMVDELGLADVADHVESVARAARLNPPSHFGTEVVARYLGLRYDHPYPYGEKIELYPWQPITRAEAAWSLAQVLGFSGWEVDDARQTLSQFSLPTYTAAQLRPLRIAVSKIGMPYVWGGETDGPSPGQVHGGYDCSGFAWRVYKLSGLPAGRKILGRTAAQQAGEIPRSRRLHLAQVQPGDLLFFGPGKFWQKATESRIIHEGIALSKDWAIHSSSQGVYVLPLFDGWLHDQFVWARRVL